MERDRERDAPETLSIPSHRRKLWVFLSILLVLPIVLSPLVLIDAFSNGENRPNLAFAICMAVFGVLLLSWQIWFAVLRVEFGDTIIVHYFLSSRKIRWEDVQTVYFEERTEFVNFIPVVVRRMTIDVAVGKSISVEVNPTSIDKVCEFAELHRLNFDVPSALLNDSGPTTRAVVIVVVLSGILTGLGLCLALFFADKPIPEAVQPAAKNTRILIDQVTASPFPTDPVDEAISKAGMDLKSSDPAGILEHLVEESPTNREFRFRLANEYLKAMEGKVIYGNGRITFDRNVAPQVRMELQRKAVLLLKMLLEHEPDNPKYLKAYAKALQDVSLSVES